MRSFLVAIERFEDKKKAFVFTTCGLYSANTNRIFIKEINKYNIVVGKSSCYRSPATDGILLFPKIKFQQNYSNNLASQIKTDIEWIKYDMKDENVLNNIPRFKLFSIFNYPNKMIAKHYYHPTIYINEEKCIHCHKCVQQCHNQSIGLAEENHLMYDKNNCEHCYRCIHQCPKGALSLRKGKSHPIIFTDAFFENKKHEILEQMKSM